MVTPNDVEISGIITLVPNVISPKRACNSPIRLWKKPVEKPISAMGASFLAKASEIHASLAENLPNSKPLISRSKKSP